MSSAAMCPHFYDVLGRLANPRGRLPNGPRT